ncbi:hypothetical protein DRE_03423 [Drechslerella stenobrocha 248]|uniref:Uncharacterized protein n=1 Tax=Drechslerella stenobrocha 248 TaxID=1043628 RepID=W7HUV1_9PEZI|nr:hypothetical protein DRE_03423 [Drechslerella stenobrocha 248]
MRKVGQLLQPEPGYSPLEAPPPPIETQPSAPEVVPGGGDHHERPGPEVVDNSAYQAYFAPDSGLAAVKPQLVEYEGWKPDQKRQRRICGLRRRVFFILLGLLLVVAAVGAVVGRFVNRPDTSERDGPPRPTDPSAPSGTTVPIAVGAVSGSNFGVGNSVIRQDNNTQMFYITMAGTDPQRDTVLISGLDPPPSKNTSFAMLQAPGSTTMRLFYTAENNTMFDAYGTADNGNWTMGRLAVDTRYRALVSPGSGFAATPWAVKNRDNNYSLRVYYVDRATQSVQEIAYDQGGNWVLTFIRLPRALSNGKVALAWVQASNFSFTDNQVLHVFYQDQQANLVHVPTYDGIWNITEYSENLGALAEGTYLAASVTQDTVGTNNTLRVMWLSQDSHLTLLRGEGASPRIVKGFQPRGTFSTPMNVVNLPESRNLAVGAVPGGTIAALSFVDEIRVFYQSGQTETSIVEVAFDGRSWYTIGLAT